MLKILKSIYWVNNHKVKFILFTASLLLATSIISKIIRNEIIDINYLSNVAMVNIFFGILFPLIKKWIKISERFRIFELENYFAIVAFALLCFLLVSSFFFFWIYDSPLDIFCFALPWFITYYGFSYCHKASKSKEHQYNGNKA